MSKKSVAITGVATLVAGIVIGSSTSASSDTAAAPKPQVKVHTVTKTRTVHDRVEVVPSSCLKAIHTSETVMADLMPDAMDITLGYIDLVQKAAVAGANQDVSAMYDVRDRITELTHDTNDITQRLKPLSVRFKTNRDACEAAAN